MTTPSDTPRTDEENKRMDYRGFVGVPFARKLERELAERNKQLAELREIAEEILQHPVCYCAAPHRCNCGAREAAARFKQWKETNP